MSSEMEYAAVCALAADQLKKKYKKLFLKVLTRTQFDFTKTYSRAPRELGEEIEDVLLAAKAMESVCVVSHPNLISDDINRMTELIFRSFQQF